MVPIADKVDSTGNVILDGNILLGNITCISKARLGDYITNLTPNEMKEVDKAISISLNINHYYQTLQNDYDDKLQYIEKLKQSRSILQADLAAWRTNIDEIQALLNKYNFSLDGCRRNYCSQVKGATSGLPITMTFIWSVNYSAGSLMVPVWLSALLKPGSTGMCSTVL